MENIPPNYGLKQEILDSNLGNQGDCTHTAAIPRVLSTEEYPGPLNFEVTLDPLGSKNPWVVSVKIHLLHNSCSKKRYLVGWRVNN